MWKDTMEVPAIHGWKISMGGMQYLLETLSDGLSCNEEWSGVWLIYSVLQLYNIHTLFHFVVMPLSTEIICYSLTSTL